MAWMSSRAYAPYRPLPLFQLNEQHQVASHPLHATFVVSDPAVLRVRLRSSIRAAQS